MSASRRTHLAVWLAVLLALLGALSVSAQGGYRLTILHSGENHGHWDIFTQTVSLGGIARRATLVQRVRAEGGNTLLLDSGDVSQGTLYFNQHRLSEGAAFYSALGYDAVGIGNHEFDLGPRTFAENWLANARFDIVSTNLDFSGEPLLAGRVRPYLIRTLGSEKIGILGFTTEDVTFSSNMGPTIRVKPRVEAARAALAELAAQGVSKVVALSHLGFTEDRKFASAVDGIDVIVGGHTPTLLGDPAKLPLAVGIPEGPYPTVVRALGGAPVLIVFAGEWGKVLGRLDVSFDANGIATQWGGAPIVVDASVPVDPAVEELRKQFAAPLGAYRRAVIGTAVSDLDGSARLLRSAEAPLGNLVADAMLDAARGDGAQIALMNGGGIRSGVKAGEISVGQVMEMLPFGNRLVQLDVSGAILQAALENGVSRIGEGAGRFPQVAGLRFAYDAGKPVGQRVAAVEIGTFQSGFQRLVPGANYRLVTNDFLANGGDGFEMFTQGTNVRGGDVPLDSALVEYIRSRGAVDPKAEGRIVADALPVVLPPAQATTAPLLTALPPTAVPTAPTVPPAVTLATVAPTRLAAATVLTSPTQPPPALATALASATPSPESQAPYPDVATLVLGVVLVVAVASILLAALRRRQ